MEEVNALKIRNNLGEILDRLNDKGEPILISKGRKIRAVLVTPEQFENASWIGRLRRRKRGSLRLLRG